MSIWDSFFKKKEEEKITNKYDNGTIWSVPEENNIQPTLVESLSTSSRNPYGVYEGLYNPIETQSSSSAIDPLQSSRNQIDYFTNQLGELGQEAVEPSIWSKLGKTLSSTWNRAIALPSTIENTIAGTIDSSLEGNKETFEKFEQSESYKKAKNMGLEVKKVSGLYQITDSKGYDKKEISKLNEEIMNDYNKSMTSKNPIKEVIKNVSDGLKSGGSTASGVITGEYSDNNVDWGRLLEKNRINPDTSVSDIVKAIETPGYGIAKLFGANNETAQNVGNIVGDVGISILSGNVTDIADAGKSIKYLRNADKVNDISKVANMDDALKLAKKYNNFDDYVKTLGDKASKYSKEQLTTMFDKSNVKYAEDLVRDVNKGLGGLENFEGVKIGSSTLISKEALDSISQSKVKSALTQVGLGLYSPVGALKSNPITDKLSKIMNESEVGKVVTKEFKSKFVNGKGNEWINAMKENPSKALEYANERKQVELAKNLSEGRITETMNTINKYSDMKETPEELTKIIEEPTTRKVREVAVEKEINDPKYILEMINLGKNDLKNYDSSLKTMQNKLKLQKEELIKTAKGNINNTKKIEGIDSEISNIQKRLDKINSVTSAKSIDFNEQMKKFGYEDKDFSEMFDKAIRTDIESLTKEVGDRDLAEALQSSANRTLDYLDKKIPGLSEYYSGYGKVDLNKVIDKNALNFETPKDASDYEKLINKDKMAKSREYLDKALADNDKGKIKFFKSATEKDQRAYARELIKDIGIDVSKKDNTVYNEMIDSLGLTEGEEFVSFLESKKKYIEKSKVKSTSLKEVREYLGTEGESISKDIIDMAKKRLEGGESPSLTHSSKYKLYRKANNSTKVASLDDFEVKKILNNGDKLNIKSDKELNALAKQISYQDGAKANSYVYESNVDTKITGTINKIKELVGSDVTNYIGKKESKEIAQKFIDETGMDIPLKEVRDKINLLSLGEAKQAFIELASDYRNKIDSDYVNIAKKMTDDEIELFKAQKSAYKLQPQEVFAEFQEKNGVFYKSKEYKTSNFNKLETETKRLRKENAKLEAMSKDDAVLQTSGSQDISVLGQDRSSWSSDLEAERYNKTMAKDYTGIDEEAKIADNFLTESGVAKDEKYLATEERVKKINDLQEKRRLELIKQEGQNKAIPEEVATDIDNLSNDIPKAVTEPIKATVDTPIAKIMQKDIPEDLRKINGIKFDTPSGKVLIESDISSKDLDSILNPTKYGKSETGSNVIYTTSPIKEGNKTIATYSPKTDTISINLNGLNRNKAKTILEHEMGHRVVSKLYKEVPDFDIAEVGVDFIKHFKTLNEKQQNSFVEIMAIANKENVPTFKALERGAFTKYLTHISNNTKDLKIIGNEGFAELHSLFNNTNKRISSKIKKLDEGLYSKYVKQMDSFTGEELKEVGKISRKNFGEEYSNQIFKLSTEREALQSTESMFKKALEVKDTQDSIEGIKDNISKLTDAMDSHTFDENGNIVSTDYEEFFDIVKKNNPDRVELINSKMDRYKKVTQLEEEVLNIDNTTNLSDEAKSFMEEYKKEMKDIAIREGIYDEEDAEAFVTYVMHDINPMYKEEAEIIEKGRKLKAELSNPLNVNSLSRTKEGTIEELNKASENEMGKRIFEENINRILLKRKVNSEKFVLKNSQNNRILEEFSIPVIRDFNEAVNSSDHLFDTVGGELLNKLNLTKKELIKDFKDSGLSSFDYYYTKTGVENKSLMRNGYIEDLSKKYGFDLIKENPLDNIPKATEDGRPLVYKNDFKGDKTKEMPYGIEGKEKEYINYVKSYNDFIYKQAKDRDMIIIELPKENPTIKKMRVLSDEGMEQANVNRTNIAEHISNVLQGDKEALEGFEALAGYNVVDPKHISYEEFAVDNGAKKVVIDRQAWENYQKAIKDAEYKEKNGVTKIFDYMTNLFKSQAIFTVSFHERNALQNIVASYTKTGANLLDPIKNKEAIDLLRYNSGKIKNIDKLYNGYNVDEILREASLGGIFETQMKNEFSKDVTKQFLAGETDKLAKKKTPISKLINPLNPEFAGYTASRKLGSTIEEQAKMVNIITHLENGFSLSDAIELTNKTLFDYSDLTKFESTTMRKLFPFYTFMRKNIPSQIDNLANNTAKVARVQSAYRKASEKNETDKDRALRPDYLDGQLALGNGKFANIGNATDDLNKLTNPLELASALNPIVKAPLELLFNKQLYSGSDISKYDKPSEKAKYIVESNVPITRQVNALHKLLTGTEEEKTKAGNTLKKTVGSLVNSYDTAKQEKATMYQYVQELQNQYYEYLENNPGAKEELQRIKDEKSNSLNPIEKLLKKRNGN